MSDSLNAEISSGLPFEPKQQDALLGHILQSKGFFMQCKILLKGSWFLDAWNGKLYDSYNKFYDKWNRLPYSDDEFLSWDDINTLPQLEKQKVKGTYIRVKNESKNYGTDILLNGLTGWLQSRIYHEYVNSSAKAFNSRQFEKAKSILSQAVSELHKVKFDGNAPADWSNPRALVQAQLFQAENALTLGHPLLDKHLNPDCKSGSLLPGDTTIFLGATNAGKTKVMSTVARHNIMAGKRVLIISHEGRQNDIMESIWCCTLNCTKAQFRKIAMSDDPSKTQALNLIGGQLRDRLVYIHLQKPGLTVEEVLSVASYQQQRLKVELGEGFDMFIDDYLAICGTEDQGRVKMERRQRDAYVYRQFVDWNGAEGTHGVSAIQTNRDGYRINSRTGDHKRSKALVTLDTIQETYEVTNSATNLIPLTRTPDDMANDRITFLLAKSRSSETGWAVTCKSNFKHSLTHHPNMSAIAFRGSESPDQIESLLQTFKNSDIPDTNIH